MDDATLLTLTIPQLITLQVQHQVTAVHLLTLYIKRAKQLHAATNCITCFVPHQDALQYAQHCDDHLSQTGKPIGLLHGIPCTIKDHYAVKNLPITMGLPPQNRTSKGNKQSLTHDSAVVLTLRSHGAVLFAKTNMTQNGDTWGGGNNHPDLGDTLNPWNTLRTSGGSSCGEGAVVGGGGSVFGIGSDVGGSVRIPASFCGVCGFKPTASRFSLSWDDGRTINGHEKGITATGGILAKSCVDITTVCQVLWSKQSLMHSIDVRMPPLVFDSERCFTSSGSSGSSGCHQTKNILTIGYTEKGYAHPTPAPCMINAVQKCVQVFKEMSVSNVDIRVVEFDASEIVPWKEIHPVLLGMYGIGIENAHEYKRHGTSSKRNNKQQRNSYGNSAVQNSDRSGDYYKDHPDFMANFNNTSVLAPSSLLNVATTTEEVYDIIALRDRQRDLLYREMKRRNIDVILCPSFSTPAPPVEEVRNQVHSIWATQAFNYFDMPCGVVPCGFVTAEDLDETWSIEKQQTNDSDFCDEYKQSLLKSRIDSVGLPVSVQLVGLPWREESVLNCMLMLEEELKRKKEDEQDGTSRVTTMKHNSLLVPVPRRCRKMGERPVEISVAKM